MDQFSTKPLSKSLTRILIGVGVVSLLVSSGVFYSQQTPKTEPIEPKPVIEKTKPAVINALGRIEPEGEVIKVSAPSSSGGGGAVISQLLVKEGEMVQAGRVIAIIDSRDRLQASLEEALAKVTASKAKLAQVGAGAKQGELAARKAQISKLKVERQGEILKLQASIDRHQAMLQNAAQEFQRYRSLYTAGAISASLLDSKRLAVQTAQAQRAEATAALQQTKATLQAQIVEAEATLNQTAEVRPTDIAVEQAAIAQAIASVAIIKADLQTAYIRAPRSGRILRIRAKEGETIGTNGIVELARTEQMVAIAEVYESDITKIRIGQIATITSPSGVFSGQLRGTVQQIGDQIAKKDILGSDPTAATDARVIEVKIRIDTTGNQKVARLINLQVNVEIEQ
jgi:HlyD family secretion protein